MFHTKVVKKIKTHILHSVTFLQKSCCYRANLEKCCRAGEVGDDFIKRCMRIASRIPKAADTHNI